MSLPAEPFTPATGIFRSNIGRILLFVLGPALVAGIFSVAPKIYDEVTKTRTELTYSIFSGPAVPVPNGYRRIFAVSLQDSGKSALSDVNIEITVLRGEIEILELDKNMLRPSKTSGNPTVISIKRMLPTDGLTASIMTMSPTSDSALEINARSNEVVGVPMESIKKGREFGFLDILFPFLAVGAMAIFYLTIRRRGELDISEEPIERVEIVLYILMLSGVTPALRGLSLAGREIRYAHLADILLTIALRGDPDKRQKCVNGLRSLLLVGAMVERSARKVRQNLNLLGVSFSDADFDAIRQQAQKASELDVRKQIFDLFAAQTSGTVAA